MENVFRHIRLKTLLPPLLLALLVGAVYAAPYVVHMQTLGYQGIFMADQGDADFYLSVINKSYTSDGLIGNPFLYEYSEVRNPFQYFLFEFGLGKTARFFNIPIDALATGAQFVFPALLALLLYMFVHALSGQRLTALIVAAAMLLGNELLRFDGLGNILQTLRFDGMYREFLTYSRPVNPQISGIVFFAVLFAHYKLFQTKRWEFLVLSGAGLGFLAYVYPYFWAFAFVVLGVMFLYALSTRDFKLLRAVVGAGLVCMVVMVPFVAASVSVFGGAGGSDLANTIPTHRSIVEKVVVGALMLYGTIFASAVWGKGRMRVWATEFKEKYTFVFLLLLSALIVSNQQVLTGRLMFQEHFHFFTNIPVCILALGLIGAEVLQVLRPVWRRVGVVAVLGVLIWHAVGVQASSYKGHAEDALKHQALAPLFAHLRAQGGDKVVLTNAYLATRLPIYTQDYVYTGGYDAAFAVPKERMEHDYFVLLRLRGVSAETVRDYMYKNRNEVGALLFIGTYWRDWCGSYGCFPDKVLEDLVPKYYQFLRAPFLTRLHEHKIDYVLWDRVSEREWQLQTIVEPTPVVESGDFKLYAVRQP